MENLRRMVTISVEGDQFVFDLQKLTEVSPYFEKMFNGSYMESMKNGVKLEEVSLETFKFFSQWISDKEIDLNEMDSDFVLRLFVFSDRFMVDELKKKCCEQIGLLLKSSCDDIRKNVLELAVEGIYIQLKYLFTDWLYVELKTPKPYTRKGHIESAKASCNFVTEGRYEWFIKDTSEEVRTLLLQLLDNHEVLLDNEGQKFQKIIDDVQDKIVETCTKLVEMVTNFDANRILEIEAAVNDMNTLSEEMKRLIPDYKYDILHLNQFINVDDA